MTTCASAWLTRTVAHSGQIRQRQPSRLASSRSAIARGMWQYGQMIRGLKFCGMTVFLYSYSGGAILYADFIRQWPIKRRTKRYVLLQSVTCVARHAPVSFNSCAVPQQPDDSPPSGRPKAPRSPRGAFTLWRAQRVNPFCSAPCQGVLFQRHRNISLRPPGRVNQQTRRNHGQGQSLCCCG